MKRLIQASWVIARRDFTAVIFSKSFIFFLLGPFFPILIGLAAGGVGSQVAKDINQPVIAIAMAQAEVDALITAHHGLADQLGSGNLPFLAPLAKRDQNEAGIAQLLNQGSGGKNYMGVLSGSLDHPHFTATPTDVARWQGTVGLILQHARDGQAKPARLTLTNIKASDSERNTSRLVTAQLAQMILFLLTMLLAGMVLSNLVEEKTNKIIEILAASVPIDAIFLGKLFAMLGMAFIGISVWFGAGAIAVMMTDVNLPLLATPAVSWPLFFVLAITYFTTAYLLLGSLFLGIGGMASSVREVQTLSMPVTMAQLLFFFLASFTVTKTGEPIELFAVLFPFSSPFAMLARAAQEAALWPHVLALLWQVMWTGLIIRIGARLFRRNVLKSGRMRVKRRSLLARLFKRNHPV
ncbi:ABC transporter permease [Aquisediminimonas sediminicola]|uniref:ABC transporter permease n=1 Tax=Alteraquisediminimonas sediminicola TaxID=2676787 RepID=UPI001C8D0512|nr:ABC transporter permease [Aquisediminimonas sediminicola]